LREALNNHSYKTTLHDTEFSDQELEKKGFTPCSDLYASGAEVVFLVTMHQQYTQLDFKRLAESGVRVIVDGRNQLNQEQVENAGMRYIGIGR